MKSIKYKGFKYVEASAKYDGKPNRNTDKLFLDLMEEIKEVDLGRGTRERIDALEIQGPIPRKGEDKTFRSKDLKDIPGYHAVFEVTQDVEHTGGPDGDDRIADDGREMDDADMQRLVDAVDKLMDEYLGAKLGRNWGWGANSNCKNENEDMGRYRLRHQEFLPPSYTLNVHMNYDV
jgi:hypothetical protein